MERPETLTPLTLLSFLGAPGKGETIILKMLEMAGGQPFQGRLENERGEAVGVLENFKYRFVNFDGHENLFKPCPKTTPEADERPVFAVSDCQSGRFTFNGNWFNLADYLIANNGDDKASSASFTLQAKRADLVFLKHPWSGECQIRVNGHLVETLDLYNPSSGIPFVFAIEGQVGNLIEVCPTGRKSPESMGTQVIIEKFFEHLDSTAPVIFNKIEERNRGSVFPPRFFDLVAEVPADGIILDLGGGRRQLNDARYVNLEYGDFEEADLYGDALCLPFKDNSINFVFSAAVMEHVRDPLKMGSEIARVLKPGGIALVNAAFMQPIHSERQHFFNVTPYGLDEAMRHLKKRGSWWDGNLSHMLRWFLQVSKLEWKSSPEDYQTFVEIAERMDALLDDEGLMYIASGVWFEGVKE